MPDDYFAIVAAEFGEAGLALTDEVHLKLGRYCVELERWNQKINLTALHGQALVRRLLVEPAWIAQHLNMSGTLLDIGSGNGSPAIPIQIYRQIEYAELVEARTRRAAFLRHVASALQLNTKVYRAIFQDVLAELRRPDWVTLQAVAPTLELVESIRTLAKASTVVIWITSEAAAVRHASEHIEGVVRLGSTAAVLLRV